MIVDAHAIAELAAEQRRGRHVEYLAGEIPQSHLDATDGADQIVGRSVRPRPAQAARSDAEIGVDRIDLERVFSHQPRLEREDLLLHSDAGTPIGFGNAEQSIVGRNLHECVGTATLEQHRLHVANLHALALGGSELVELEEKRKGGGVAKKLAARNGSH